MKNANVTLVPLTPEDREQFILDNQWAFKYGAMLEFGERDDHLDYDGEIISRQTIETCMEMARSYKKRVMIDFLNTSREQQESLLAIEGAIFCLHISKDEQELIRYCRDVLELANPLIKVHKIKIQSLIKINGYFAYLTGRTGNQLLVRNAVNLCLDSKWTKYIKKVEKFNEQGIIDDLISLDNNIQLYEELITKHTEGIYKNRPNPIGTKLIAKRDKFKSLSIEEQCCIILELLRMTSIGGNGADLSLLGESKQSGTMKISKDITKIEELKIINQSITGIYKSPYVDLNKV